MFNNLVESKPKKNKKMGGTIFSFIAHYGLILFVIYTSAQAATQDDGPKQEKVDFVEVKKEEAPKPKEPPPPELVAAPPPPKGFQVLTAPVEIPNVLPDIDLTAVDTNRSVSRRHAKIIRSGQEYLVLEEVGTVNGTYVNEQRIPTGVPVTIHNGDMVKIGLIAMKAVFD